MFCRVRLHQEWQRDVSRTASSAHFSVARDSLSPSLRPRSTSRRAIVALQQNAAPVSRPIGRQAYGVNVQTFNASLANSFLRNSRMHSLVSPFRSIGHSAQLSQNFILALWKIIHSSAGGVDVLFQRPACVHSDGRDGLWCLFVHISLRASSVYPSTRPTVTAITATTISAVSSIRVNERLPL